MKKFLMMAILATVFSANAKAGTLHISPVSSDQFEFYSQRTEEQGFKHFYLDGMRLVVFSATGTAYLNEDTLPRFRKGMYMPLHKKAYQFISYNPATQLTRYAYAYSSTDGVITFVDKDSTGKLLSVTWESFGAITGGSGFVELTAYNDFDIEWWLVP